MVIRGKTYKHVTMLYGYTMLDDGGALVLVDELY